MMLVPSALTWGSGDQSCEPPLWLRRLFCFQCGTASTTALEAPVANSVAEVSGAGVASVASPRFRGVRSSASFNAKSSNEIRVSAEHSRRRNSVGLNVGGMGGVAGLYGFSRCPRRLVMAV